MTARMRILSFVLALIAGLFCWEMKAAEGAWTSNGPYGAPVYAIAASPGDPSRVYISTPLGVYRSTDGGGLWEQISSVGEFSLLVPTSDPSTLYAGEIFAFGAPIHRSRDGGATWEALEGPGGRIGSISVDPNDPMTLYVLSTTGRLRSSDGGISWVVLAEPAPVSELVSRIGGMTGIAVDPRDSNVLYTGVLSTAPGVYRSTDRGASWNLTGLRVGTYSVLSSADGSRIYSFTTQGLQVSADRGGSWRKIAARQISPTYFALDPVDPRVLYTVFLDGVYYSSDGGETMNHVDRDFGGLAPLRIAGVGRSSALVGSDIGISRTEDAGRTWKDSNVGLPAIQSSSLAVDPQDPAVVVASNGSGIFESRDTGQSWRRLRNSSFASVVAIDPTDSSTLYAGGIGLLKSTDGGRTWQDRTPRVPGSILGRIADLLIDPNNRRRILASSQSVFRSNDGADHWDEVMRPDDDYWTYSYYYYPRTPPMVTKMTMAPSDGTTVYAGGSESGGFLYRSRDGGNTWSDLKNHFPVSALAVDSCYTSILHAGGAQGVYRSLDGGDTFQLGSIPAVVNALTWDPKHSATVFAGTSVGLFWSIDRGATWARFEPALDETVVSIALDPTGRFLYAGTARGVFALERSFEACRDGPDNLCLIGAKYEVSVTARHPTTGALMTGHAIPQGDQFGYFSFPDVTGNPDFPEVFVKMVNASGAPPPYGGSDWVFHSSLTSLDYTLTVRETDTGRARTYRAARTPDLTCGSADTSAFVRACEPASSATSVPGTRLSVASGGELRLLGNRFRASVRATDPRTGRVAEGAAILQGDGFGYFSLPGFTGDASFPEVFVKMVDGRSQPGASFWVFHTSLTDVEYTVTVTDTITGNVRMYPRGAVDGMRLCGVADTRAFHD